MQTIKIIIPGHFWDSYIYCGKLYLFDMNGKLTTVDWNTALGKLPMEEGLHLPFECAFLRSDLLYGDNWTTVFNDPDVRNLITQKFELLSTSGTLELELSRIPSSTSLEQETPFPFPHSDITIFKKTMYAAAQSGVYGATCNKNRGRPVNGNSDKLWDCPVLSISAAYGNLALATGSEGLHELPVSDYLGRTKPEQLETRNCVSGSWTYFSIYGSSHREGGFLIAYENQKNENYSIPQMRERHKLRTFSQDDLFHKCGYSWGFKNRICLAGNGGVHLLEYYPYGKESDPVMQIKDLGFVDLHPWEGEVVSGAITAFGIIIECENALVIVPSNDEEAITLPGEPVNWRVFPKSKYYQNQLHVIYDDRLEILSFNHDYFVNQKNKRCGIRPELKREG